MLKSLQEMLGLHPAPPVDGASQQVGQVPSLDEHQRLLVQRAENKSVPLNTQAQPWVLGFVRAGWPAG